MLKLVPIGQLRPGMYVHNLNCGWLDHTFARNRFLIKDQAAITRIKSLGVEEVWVDANKSTVPLEGETAPTAASETSAEVIPIAKPRSLAAEKERALKLRQEAARTVEASMKLCRLGHPIELRPVAGMVDDILDSLDHNQDILLGICRLRSKDHYTFEHSVNVGILGAAMGRALELKSSQLQELALGGLLHDIGKSRTPLRILNKPGRLDTNEFAIVKRHVDHGERIAASIPSLPSAALAAITEHHERLDGSGYPRGLKGENISLFGRIIAICDVYDAMTADRCYRDGDEPTRVMQRMLQWCGTHFDTALVHKFIRCVGIYPIGTLVGLASGRLGMVMQPGKKGLLYPIVRVFYDIHRRHHLQPSDIDLSSETDESIVSYESAERWELDPNLVPQLE